MNKILQLRCNGGTGELGITKPVFSWGLESDEILSEGKSKASAVVYYKPRRI